MHCSAEIHVWPFPHHLQEAESNRLCRRLQLKDIIPAEMQRFTKYPLLMDNIAKNTGMCLTSVFGVDPKIKNVIIYSPLCVSKHVDDCFNCSTQKKIFREM